MREKKYRLRNGVVVVPEALPGWVRVVDTQNAVFTDSSSACCTARELSKFWAVGARNALRPCTADPLSWKGFAWGEQFDTISDALGLDEYEHPALRARKAIAASRLPAIKPGEVETCEWHPGDIPGTGVRGWKTACGEAMYPKHRWRLGVDGFNYCPNCGKRVVQVSDDEWAAQSAQATTSGEVGR